MSKVVLKQVILLASQIVILYPALICSPTQILAYNFFIQWRIRISEWTEVPCWIQDFDQSRHRASPHQDERPSYQ